MTMQKILLLSALTLVTGFAAAQETGRVISATPITQQIAVPRQVCSQQQVAVEAPRSGAGALMGGIAGGAMGNAIGGGSGRAAATMLGVLGGVILGNSIEGPGQTQWQTVQNCSTQTFYENRTVGYTVVYEYAGRQYSTQTQSDPGRYLDVQVQPVGQNARPALGAIYSTQPGPYPYPYATPQGDVGQTAGVVYRNAQGVSYEEAYPQRQSAPAPVYLNPAVEQQYDQGWGSPYDQHHPQRWR